jgi:hypothetical protein
MTMNVSTIGAVAALAVAGVLGYVLHDPGSESKDVGVRTFDRPPDPPPEYLYLDTARVLAYLGQVDEGLTKSERRSVSLTNTAGGKIAGAGVEASASTQRVGSIEQDVTAGTTDRFYRLLGALAEGQGKRKWMYSLNAGWSGGHETQDPYHWLERVQVGDFLKLSHARVFLPPYSMAYPRTAYAAPYLGPHRRCLLRGPSARLGAPASVHQRQALRKFHKAVGKNPRMTFIMPPRQASVGDEQIPVHFVLPVHYKGLTSEPSSLAGEVTVVGKVLAIEDVPLSQHKRPCRGKSVWTDRQTVRQFGAAVRHASKPLLRLLHAEHASKSRLTAMVHAGATFPKPAVVVLPIAIYQ